VCQEQVQVQAQAQVLALELEPVEWQTTVTSMVMKILQRLLRHLAQLKAILWLHLLTIPTLQCLDRGFFKIQASITSLCKHSSRLSRQSLR
jgi:hypothetical protein